MRADGAATFFFGRAGAFVAGALVLLAGERPVLAPPPRVVANGCSGSRAAATASSTRPTPAAAEVRLPAACLRAADSPSSSLMPPRYQQVARSASMMDAGASAVPRVGLLPVVTCAPWARECAPTDTQERPALSGDGLVLGSRREQDQQLHVHGGGNRHRVRGRGVHRLFPTTGLAAGSRRERWEDGGIAAAPEHGPDRMKEPTA